MELLAIGRALCLASCVTYGMVSLSGMSGGRGLDASERKNERGKFLAIALAGALLAQTAGLVLVYSSLGRIPATAFDAMILVGMLMGGIALWLGRLRAHPVVRAPLAGGAFVASTLCFGITRDGTTQLAWPDGLSLVLVVLLCGVALSIALLSFRRLLRRADEGRLASLLACILMLGALGPPWGGIGDEVRPFQALHAADGEPVYAQVAVRSLEGKNVRMERTPVRVGHETLDTGRTICLVLLLIGLLFSLFEWMSPTVFYKTGLFFSLLGSAFACLILLGMVGWTLFSGEVIEPAVAETFTEALRNWGNEGLPSEAVAVGQVQWSAPAGLIYGVASDPDLWFLLLTCVPVFAIAAAYRVRGLTSPVRNQKAVTEREALAHAELGLIVLCLFAASAWLFGMMFLSIHRFGVVEVGDPRIFISLGLVGVVGGYLAEFRRGQAGELRSQLLGLACGLLGLLFLLGPSLGWTVRSIFAPFQ